MPTKKQLRKIAAHRAAMRASIGCLCGIRMDYITIEEETPREPIDGILDAIVDTLTIMDCRVYETTRDVLYEAFMENETLTGIQIVELYARVVQDMMGE
jgi:hypothetical protein